MRVFERRDSPEETVASAKEIDPTLVALATHINEVLRAWLGGGVTADMLVLHPQGLNALLGCDTWLVAIEGYGAFWIIDQFPEVAR